MDKIAKDLDVKKQPLVSILMLSYNRAHYIKDAVKSILNQTYQNWQLYIIDDGSVDNTHSIITAYKDTRINYIRHFKNAGLHSRRKESLSYVRGKYVAIIDSDDIWILPEKLELQVSEMEKNDKIVLIGTQTKLLDEKGNLINNYYYETSDKKIRNKILMKNQFTHSGVLMRSETVKKTKGYTPILAEDLELFLQLGQLGEFANLDLLATGHRVHDDSENDHGIKMSSAVHRIIRWHKNEYPNYHWALLFSYFRLLKCYIKNITKHQTP